jgi:hypothetical protein
MANFWRKLTDRKTNSSRHARRGRSPRPRLLWLEALEDRITPNGTVTVSTTNDVVDGTTTSIAALIANPGADGKISLREALMAANNTPSTAGSPNTINVPDGTYDLTMGELPVGNATNLDTVIVGTSLANTIIEHDTGTANARVFDVDLSLLANVQFSISNCTIAHGRATTFGGGGIITGATNSVTTVNNVKFLDNQETVGTVTNRPGGAIQNISGSLSVTNCDFESNNAAASAGGAIYYDGHQDPNHPTLTVTGSTFNANTTAPGASAIGGGAIFATNGTLNITNNTFTSNTLAAGTGDGGGAIEIESGTVTVTGNNFDSNQITAAGGAPISGGGAIVVGANGAVIQFNRFHNNTNASHNRGDTVTIFSGATVNLTDNWWASNSGPGTNDVVTNNAGTFSSTPPANFLKLNVAASPTTLAPGAASTVTADFTKDSANNTISASNLGVLIGRGVTWGATAGTLSNQQATVQNTGQATATYTAGSTSGPGTASATVDGVTATANLDILAHVSSVSATTANGSYGVGSVIAVTVTFSGAVTVTGTPLLTLNSGGTANFNSGSGTTTLTFTYTVASGQNSNPLDEASSAALSLNGGTIHDGAGNPVVLTLPAPGAAGSLGVNKAIVIDTTAPVVTAVTSTTANGAYGVGSVITITMGFSKPVVVTGTPKLALNSGGTASYSSGSGTSTLTFTYTVAAGQNSPKLDYTSTTALSLNGGTIFDTVTNPNAATLTLPAPGSAGSIGGSKSIVIDTTAPTVSGVSSTTANGTYGVGAVIIITVGFSKPVVVTGAPQLALNSGGTASFSSGSGTSTLSFSYTVAAGQNSPRLDYTSTSALSLSGGTIFDTVTNPNAANLTLPAPGAAGSLAANKDIVIDSVPSQVASVTSTTANGTYGVGSVITITVTFSNPVTVTGTPQLALNSGGTASYSSGSGGSTLTFSYTVAAGQNSPKLDYTSTSALALNGGTINDGTGNAANLTLPAPGSAGSIGGSKSIAIDTTAPTVTAVTSTTANGAYGVGSVITITMGFSKPVVVTGTPQLALNSGGTASFSSGSGTSTLSFTYTVAAGQNSPKLDYTSTSALSLNGGTIFDTVTNPNAASLTLPAPGSAGSIGGSKSIVIDTTAPTVSGVSSTTANGTYGVGAVIIITVGFSKPVVVTGTPQLALNSGGTASFSSGSGTSTLNFSYTVAAGQNSPRLDYTSTSALSLNGGTIFDTVTNPNAANLTLPAPGAAGSLGANKDIVIAATPPTANPQSAVAGENTAKNLTLTGSAPNSDAFTFQIASNPSHGTLTGLNANTGVVTYTPNNGYTGPDSFTFTVTDTTTSAVSSAATVSLTVVPPPTANAQNVSVRQNSPTGITLTGTAPNGDVLSFQLVTQPGHGTLSGTAPNLTYTPNASFTGPDSFTFTVTDTASGLVSAPVTVSLTVAATFMYDWNGTVSSDWLNPANWTDVANATHHAVPGPTDTVVITGGPVDPILTANASVGNLVMGIGFLTIDANLTVAGNYSQSEGFVAFGSDANQLLIAGDITRTGGFLSSFNPATRKGTVVLDGTAAQTITDTTHPNHPLGWNLIFANTSAAGVTIASGSTPVVGNNLTVDAGAVLTLAGTATLTTDGNFTDNGTLNLTVPAPGNATAPLVIGGTLTMNAGSVFNLTMGLPASGVTYLFIQYGSFADNGAQFNFFGEGGFTPTKHENATSLTVSLA